MVAPNPVPFPCNGPFLFFTLHRIECMAAAYPGVERPEARSSAAVGEPPDPIRLQLPQRTRVDGDAAPGRDA